MLHPETGSVEEGQYNGKHSMMDGGIKRQMFPWLIPFGAELKIFLILLEISTFLKFVYML